MKKTITLIYILLFSAACTSGRYHSYTDPSFDQSQSYKRVMVQAINFDLKSGEFAERYAKKRLQAYTEAAFRYIDIIPPTRQFNEKEFSEAIEMLQIDAILVLSLVKEGTSSNYVPQTTYGGYVTQGTVNTYGNTSYLNMTTTSPTTTGGYYINNPIASYEGVLFDANTEEKIWLSSMQLQGNAFSNHTKLAAKAGSSIVKRLARDRLIQPIQVITNQN